MSYLRNLPNQFLVVLSEGAEKELAGLEAEIDGHS